VSSGSACTSASLEPSYVLRACGVSEDLAHTSIRFGIGRFNSEDEVDYVAKYVVEQVKRLREMSPLYEMANEGIDLSKIECAAHGADSREKTWHTATRSWTTTRTRATSGRWTRTTRTSGRAWSERPPAAT